MSFRLVAVLLCLASSSFRLNAQAESIARCNVSWDTPGKDYKDSMPIGNGDIGLNVWTEQNGDLVFLIGKTDAWSENGQLVKLGRVRVKTTPNSFTKGRNFHQELRLNEGEIQIGDAAGAVMRVWVDANHPVVHIEVNNTQPAELQASVELWRLAPRETLQKGAELDGMGVFREWNNTPDGRIVIDPDTILPARNNQVSWCHRNERSMYPQAFQNQHLESLLPKYPDPLIHRTFGAVMSGKGLVSVDDRTLKSQAPASVQRIDLTILTQQTDTLGAWQSALSRLNAANQAVSLEAARKAHQQWWAEFWSRSWINVSGSPQAEQVTQGYALQRWMDACGGRGAMPIKYNGSIFTVGQEPPPGAAYDPAKGQRDADYRNWGGNYWFQNNRLMYWPMLAAGDFDLMAPFFKMYADALPLMKDRTKLYFEHEGAAFPETIHFWGLPNNNDFGWGNKDVVMKNTWIRHYVSGGIELSAMMLDRFDYTQDQDFARRTLLPIAVAVTTYYDQHWPRDADGEDTHGPRAVARDPAAGGEPRAGYRGPDAHSPAAHLPAGVLNDRARAGDVEKDTCRPAAHPHRPD